MAQVLVFARYECLDGLSRRFMFGAALFVGSIDALFDLMAFGFSRGS